MTQLYKLEIFETLKAGSKEISPSCICALADLQILIVVGNTIDVLYLCLGICIENHDRTADLRSHAN